MHCRHVPAWAGVRINRLSCALHMRVCKFCSVQQSSAQCIADAGPHLLAFATVWRSELSTIAHACVGLQCNQQPSALQPCLQPCLCMESRTMAAMQLGVCMGSCVQLSAACSTVVGVSASVAVYSRPCCNTMHARRVCMCMCWCVQQSAGPLHC